MDKTPQYTGLLWRWPLPTALLFSLLTIAAALILVSFAPPTTNLLSFIFYTALSSVVSVLVLVFLFRLPQGRWYQRMFFESIAFALSAGLVTLCLAIVGSLQPLVPDTESGNTLTQINWDQETNWLIQITIGLSIFSHIAVRIFAYLTAFWNRLRRRRLVWDITHAQLRLVLLGMLLLFIIMMYALLANQSTGTEEAQNPNDILPLMTVWIAVAGFMGIMTGVSVLVVIIPASILSYFTARRITRRLDTLIEGTRQVRKGDYSLQLPVEGSDEIARLQMDFNGMVHDLKQARHDLEAERDAVTRLLESRRQLFADISHELRTPVAVLRSYLEALAPVDDRAAISLPNEELNIMTHEVLRLQHMIDEVFTLANADNATLRFNIKAVDLTPILQQAVSIARKQAWQARKVEVSLDYQLQLPLVEGDPERIEQILHNLLRNAIRHTLPGGFIIVRAQPEAEQVRLDVQDTGSGIAPEDLTYIWDRFYRTAETRATDQQGAGLGLALVREMTEAMHGAVKVTSEPGQGSCFTVWLPRVRPN